DSIERPTATYGARPSAARFGSKSPHRHPRRVYKRARRRNRRTRFAEYSSFTQRQDRDSDRASLGHSPQAGRQDCSYRPKRRNRGGKPCRAGPQGRLVFRDGASSGNSLTRRAPHNSAICDRTSSTTDAQSPGAGCRKSRMEGYHGESERPVIQRQSPSNGSSVHTGFPIAPAKCAITVSTVITRSILAINASAQSNPSSSPAPQRSRAPAASFPAFAAFEVPCKL